jgi:hypothetical protein
MTRCMVMPSLMITALIFSMSMNCRQLTGRQAAIIVLGAHLQGTPHLEPLPPVTVLCLELNAQLFDDEHGFCHAQGFSHFFLQQGTGVARAHLTCVNGRPGHQHRCHSCSDAGQEQKAPRAPLIVRSHSMTQAPLSPRLRQRPTTYHAPEECEAAQHEACDSHPVTHHDILVSHSSTPEARAHPHPPATPDGASPGGRRQAETMLAHVLAELMMGIDDLSHPRWVGVVSLNPESAPPSPAPSVFVPGAPRPATHHNHYEQQFPRVYVF